MVKDGLHTFEKSAVKRFRNSIVLRGVVRGEAPFGAFLLQELSELAAGVLTTAVRPNSLDLGAMLSVHPSCESSVSREHLVFGAKNVDAGEAGSIICEGDIVVAVT